MSHVTAPALVLADLTKSYGARPVLRGIDLMIDRGDICGLVGPNGSGKTTLISIVAGLRRADHGSVRVMGTDVATDPRQARAQLGLAPQELAVYPTATARENLVLLGELSDLHGADARRRVVELADAFDLGDALDRQVRQLSGGQQRRLHVALALLQRPPLVLLDEPTAGLDVETRIALVEIIRELAADGTGVLYSTNALAEVETLGGSVAILDDGRFVARGPVGDVIAAHTVAVLEMTFVGPIPEIPSELDGEIDGSVVRIRTDAADRDVPVVLAWLGAQASNLGSIEIVRPSLETAFVNITGRRYAAVANTGEGRGDGAS